MPVINKFFGYFCHRLAKQFVISPRLRKSLTMFVLSIAGILTLSVVANPLKNGLTGHYYDNSEWRGSPLMTVREQDLNLWRIKSEFPNKSWYSIQWTGFIYIPQTGEYEFKIKSDDGSDLFIRDQLVVENSGAHGLQERAGKITLEKGFYSIAVRYVQAGGTAEFKAYWKPPGKKKALLADAPLFVEKPTATAFLFGRVFTTIGAVCQFLCLIGLISVVLIGLSSRHILLPFLKTSGIGKVYFKCCPYIFKEAIESQAMPTPPTKPVIGLFMPFVGYAL
jgi:hypothetical protein